MVEIARPIEHRERVSGHRVGLVFPGQGLSPKEIALNFQRIRHKSPHITNSVLFVAQEAVERVYEDFDPPYNIVDIFNQKEGINVQATLASTPVCAMPVIIYALSIIDAKTANIFGHHNLRPDVFTGHSLGELAAAVAAGALSITNGARIGAKFGQLTAKANEQNSSRLVATSNLSKEDEGPIRRKCRAVLALQNGPDRRVFGMPTDKVDLFMKVVGSLNHGAEAFDLKITGYHTYFMNRVVHKYRAYLYNIGKKSGIEFHDPRKNAILLSNINGERMLTGEDVCESLILGFNTIDNWQLVVDNMKKIDGIDVLVCLGPNRTLRSLIHANDVHQQVITSKDLQDLLKG